MPKKPLFDEDDRYTPEAMQFEGEVYAALHPLISEWEAKGFSLRELEYLATAAVTDLSISKRLDSHLPPEPEEDS